MAPRIPIDRRGRAAVGLVVAALLAGACSSSDGGGAATGSGAPDGTTQAAPDTAGGADVDPATVDASPSAGCGTTEVAAGSEQVDTVAGGVDRWYLRTVPSAHDGDTPVPVVVDLHGYSEGALVHQEMTGMGEFGEAEGFVAVVPHGDGPVPRWLTSPGSEDVAFLGQVLDEVEADLCVDVNRIFVTGMSNGAMMTSVLSCDLADRIAAAAPVAGIQAVDQGCDQARPVPLVAFHGTEDPFLPWEGGIGPAVSSLPLPDGTGSLGDALQDPEGKEQAAAEGVDLDAAVTVPEATAVWAGRNGCGDAVAEEPVADDVVLMAWDCPDGLDVVLYRIDGGGHTWPGSPFLVTAEDMVGTTTMAIDANEVMWAFFEDHPLGVAG